jgi:hypothetical protein
MDSKSGNIKFTVVASKFAPSAAITLSFSAPDINWHVLQKLKQEKPCGCETLAAYSEYTAAVYSIYDDIRDRLIGTPDAQAKSKVSHVQCGFVNNDFIISYVCQSSITAIRKSIGLSLSRMAPQRQFPRYSKYIRLLGGKPKKEEFMNCAKRIAKGLNICIFVVAKINTSPTKEKAILDTVIKKMPDITGIDNGTRPSSESAPRGKTEFTELKTSGFDSLFILDYLDSINVPALGSDTGIIIFDKKWTSAKRESIDRFVDSKFGKLKEKLTLISLYSACSRALLNCPAIKSLQKAQLSVADIKKIIKTSLI